MADRMELDEKQLKETLRRCVGSTGVLDRSCEGCPLYEDHYCVDTLVSMLDEIIDQYFK